jgi:hypothetical protein
MHKSIDLVWFSQVEGVKLTQESPPFLLIVFRMKNKN